MEKIIEFILNLILAIGEGPLGELMYKVVAMITEMVMMYLFGPP